MRETAKQTVDGLTYEFWQLDPEKACDDLFILVRNFVGPLAKVIGSAGTESVEKLMSAKVDFDKIGDAFMAAAPGINKDEIKQLYRDILSVSMFEGQTLSWNHPNFQGKPLHLQKVIWKGLVANFGDFFDVLKGPAVSAGPSIPVPRTLTGGSGVPSSPG